MYQPLSIRAPLSQALAFLLLCGGASAEPQTLERARQNYQREQERLTLSYVAWLEQELSRASSANKAEDAAAYQAELSRFAVTPAAPTPASSSIATHLIGTRWFWYDPAESITFTDAANARHRLTDNDPGTMDFSWKIVDESNRTLEILRISTKTVARMTFSPDYSSATITFPNGKILKSGVLSREPAPRPAPTPVPEPVPEEP